MKRNINLSIGIFLCISNGISAIISYTHEWYKMALMLSFTSGMLLPLILITITLNHFKTK